MEDDDPVVFLIFFIDSLCHGLPVLRLDVGAVKLEQFVEIHLIKACDIRDIGQDIFAVQSGQQAVFAADTGQSSACCYYQYFLFHSSFPLIFYCPPGYGDIYIPKQDGNPAAKGNTASGISCLRPENTPRGSGVDSGQYISV